jgi:outer membrane protein insertion porin family
LENLKKKYQEHGYMEAVIGEPRIEDIEKRSIFFKKQQMKKIIVPVDAGYRYFVGDVTVEGNKIIRTEFLRSLVGYKAGDVYSISVREKAVEDIQEVYGNAGYIYAQVMPVESLDPKRKRVNVTFNIYEGEAVFLNRLEIRGNTFTKDKVIRREILIREGDRFGFSYFKNSILRMKQLGLVDLQGEPDIMPNPEDPTKMDVTLHVQEMQRNNIQFTAGYSGYQGTFVALSYSTVNFLGGGESLQLMVQYGGRIKNYSLGFTEPYVFDLPLNLGFNVFDQFTIYPYLYNRKGRGVRLNLGARIVGYWRTNVSYGYEFVQIDLPESDSDEPFVDPIYGRLFGLGNYNISSITTSLYRSTIDSPLTPTRGTLYSIGLKYAGGPLGGDIDLIKPRFEFTLYAPVIKRSVFGFHVQYQFINNVGEADVPFWEKFYLGGEQSIRGYDIYTIGPRSAQGTNIGGEKSLVINTEYIIPIGGPLYAILFFDAGNAYSSEQKVSFNNLFTSTGLELRMFVPALRVPFRLIFSYNNRKIRTSDSNFAFRFAIGTTF